MKTALFAPCYLDGDRLKRNLKWIQYYKPLLSKLYVDKIYLYDNASSFDDIWVLQNLEEEKLVVTRFGEHLERKSHLDYPYWWRAMRQAAVELTDGRYDKIIHIDTDVFIQSQKVIDYINRTNNGWVSFWEPVHNFPESTFFFVNKGAFSVFKHEMMKPIDERAGKVAELILPFTHVEKGFNGGRFAEKGLPPTPDMDFYCQTPNETKVKFYG